MRSGARNYPGFLTRKPLRCSIEKTSQEREAERKETQEEARKSSS
jgi:hypothetical protein